MNTQKPPRLDQELWRANNYQFLATLLTKPPSHRLLAQLAKIPPLQLENQNDTVAQAWNELGEVARCANEPGIFLEYRALFDTETGELSPYASSYLVGERNAKPLLMVRAELSGLGLERIQAGGEDHAGALCEIMCALIEMEDPRQIGFFTRHLKPWLPAFFRDLRTASSAEFYRPVGSLGEAFIEVERIFLRETY